MQENVYFCENCMETFDFKEENKSTKKRCPKCGCTLDLVDDTWLVGGNILEEADV